MRLHRLRLRHYRNLQRADLALHPELTVLVGPNGIGKTNVLEAIHCLSLIRSFRQVKDADLAQIPGNDTYFLSGDMETAQAQRTLSIGYDQGTKLYQIDETPIARVGEFVGQLRVVASVSDDDDMVKGAPLLRRRFLDILLSLALPGYFDSLQSLARALKQRNAALRSAGAPVAPWDPLVAKAGSEVLAARLQAFPAIQLQVAERLTEMNPELAGVTLTYKHSVPFEGNESDRVEIESSLLSELKARLERDRERGATSVGPHRDDLVLKRDGRHFKRFASQGQARLAALVLRMAMADLLESMTGETPILLLDDVLLDLDPDRKAAFWSAQSGRQIVATATDLREFAGMDRPYEVIRLADLHGHDPAKAS